MCMDRCVISQGRATVGARQLYRTFDLVRARFTISDVCIFPGWVYLLAGGDLVGDFRRFLDMRHPQANPSPSTSLPTSVLFFFARYMDTMGLVNKAMVAKANR